MRNTGKCITLAFCIILAATAGLSMAGLRGDRQPHRYAPLSLDQEPVLAVNPLNGSVLAAWGYREGREYSIALAVKTGETWSEPVFIGRDDRLDQLDPALVFDDQGVAYLAFTVLPLREIWITAFAGEPAEALSPQIVTRNGHPSLTPALSVIADRLVLAFRSGEGVLIRNFPLFRPGGTYSTNGIQEGPDAVDPLGWALIGNSSEADEDQAGDHQQSEDDQESTDAVPLGMR